MRAANIFFKLTSILSIIFFIALYLFYAIIKVRDLKEADVNSLRNIAGYLMTTSFYAIVAGLLVTALFLIKKYKIPRVHEAILMISILSWVMIFYIDPGGVFNWFFD